MRSLSASGSRSTLGQAPWRFAVMPSFAAHRHERTSLSPSTSSRQLAQSPDMQ